MTKTFTRDAVGKHFNEGARLMWLALAKAKKGFHLLEKDVEAGRGMGVRWLYGDGKPGAAFRVRMQEKYGVPILAWDAPPTEAFVVPSAREAGSDDVEIPPVVPGDTDEDTPSQGAA